MDIEVTIAGSRVYLKDKDIRSRLHGVEPGLLHVHVVEVDGVVFPVKEAFALVTGLDPLDFNTNQARGAFKRLGFTVSRQN